MKINHLQMVRIQQSYLQRKKEMADKNEISKKDSMVISKQAKMIKDLEQKINTIPDVRQEKVEEFKAAIAEGEYNIDSKVLAKKMMESLKQG